MFWRAVEIVGGGLASQFPSPIWLVGSIYLPKYYKVL